MLSLIAFTFRVKTESANFGLFYCYALIKLGARVSFDAYERGFYLFQLDARFYIVMQERLVPAYAFAKRFGDEQ